MKVLKFGGTSVANAKNISQVKNIVSSNGDTKIIVIVSALGGITDLLLTTANLASDQNKEYRTYLKEIEERHIQTIKELIPVQSQSKVLSKVKSELNTLETLLEGAFLIGEI
ncbi:MAG: amino acid kinase family protein, partial [Flavobacteriales bacterium]